MKALNNSLKFTLLAWIIVWGCGVLLFSCKTETIYIPVEKWRTEIEILDRIERDSIYVQDSIFFAIKGDTVFKEKYKTIYKDRIVRDSIVKDSIIYEQVPYPVDKPVPYYPKWMIILSIVGIGAIGWLIYKLVNFFK